ncbi:MAG: VanZ family protein [Austwickia sp.]|nr:VanZ family protein [Austwickia sp.]
MTRTQGAEPTATTRPRLRRARPWAALLAAALVAHLYVLYDPSPGGPTLFAGADKIVHVTIFALPVWLASRVLRRWVVLAVVLAIHAPVSEVIQGLALPHRSGDGWDVVADLTGVAIGAALAATVPRRSDPGRW